MAEFETGLPSVRQLQGFVRDKQEIEIKLITGDILTGHIFWQDNACICLVDPSEQKTTIWKQAIAYYKPKN